MLFGRIIDMKLSQILKKIWYPGLTVFYTFTVSLFIFPGFLTVACAKVTFPG